MRVPSRSSQQKKRENLHPSTTIQRKTLREVFQRPQSTQFIKETIIIFDARSFGPNGKLLESEEQKIETWEQTNLRWQEEINEKEKTEMLQKPGNTKRSFTGKTTAWLSDQMLNSSPRKVIIVEARGDTGGTSVIVKLDIEGKIVFDTWRHTNPNFDIAVEYLGADEKKWKGSVCEMFLEYDDFAERNWRRLQFPKSKK
jgi:hypothetical protein